MEKRQIERIHTLHRLLSQARYPLPASRLMEELQCSRASLYRDVAFLRDQLGAPLESSDDPAGFYYASGEGHRFELPGLWLSADELHALLAAQQLLARTGAGSGLLAEALEPLRGRIDSLLAEQAGGKRWPLDRIRVLGHGSRAQEQTSFRPVASAVLARKRLRFDYRARSTDTLTQRRVSPQRLTHYRDHWYLDAWDHDREALRSFALDRIRQALGQDDTAIDVAEEELKQHLSSSYGIFSGTPKAVATIVFSAHAARWVADEHWHSKQEGRFLPDGRYELKLPYSHPRELLMDIQKYGPDAEVLSPPSLRQEARILLQLALAAYANA